MIKTAIFVEGQTELIFVRELLLKIFDYQNISLECYTLYVEHKFHPTEYAVANDVAEYFFQIIDVGNDQSVLTRMLAREDAMRKVGFSRIIGLRDMYSRLYRELVHNHVIDKTINQQFIEGARNRIQSENTYFSFAIMEIEAWILGFKRIFSRMNEALTVAFIHESLNINLDVNPEETFFHPANDLDSIFQLVGMKYGKSKGEINAIVSHITKEDVFELLGSDHCNSFKEFIGFLLSSTN